MDHSEYVTSCLQVHAWVSHILTTHWVCICDHFDCGSDHIWSEPSDLAKLDLDVTLFPQQIVISKALSEISPCLSNFPNSLYFTNSYYIAKCCLFFWGGGGVLGEKIIVPQAPPLTMITLAWNYTRYYRSNLLLDHQCCHLWMLNSWVVISSLFIDEHPVNEKYVTGTYITGIYYNISHIELTCMFSLLVLELNYYLSFEIENKPISAIYLSFCHFREHEVENQGASKLDTFLPFATSWLVYFS